MELIELIRKDDGKAMRKQNNVRIPRNEYDAITSFITAELTNHNGEMLLNELIDKATVGLAGAISGDISWYLINVKQHLEASGLIKSVVDRDRVQHVQLVKKKKK